MERVVDQNAQAVQVDTWAHIVSQINLYFFGAFQRSISDRRNGKLYTVLVGRDRYDLWYKRIGVSSDQWIICTITCRSSQVISDVLTLRCSVLAGEGYCSIVSTFYHLVQATNGGTHHTHIVTLDLLNENT